MAETESSNDKKDCDMRLVMEERMVKFEGRNEREDGKN